MDFIRKRLPQINLRGVASLAVGAGLAQAIPVLSAPILSRLYAPPEFATFAIFVSLSNLGAIFATARYELAIILPAEEADAHAALVLALGLALFACGIFALVGAAVHLTGHHVFGSFLSEAYAWPTLVATGLVGVQQVFFYWENRKQRYREVAVSRVTQAVTTLLVGIGAAGDRFGMNGLVLGNVLGLLAACGFLGWNAHRLDRPFSTWPGRARIGRVAREYRRFPTLTVPHATMDSVQSNVVLYLLDRYFGAAAVGLFSFSLRVLKTPAGLVGAAISQVFYRDAAAKFNRTGNIVPELRSTMLVLAAVSFPAFAAIMAFAPSAAAFIFGRSWTDAGQVITALTPWILMNFILSPVTRTPLILDRQLGWLGITTGENLLIILALFGGAALGYALIPTLWTLSLANALYTGGMIAWLIRIARQTARTSVGAGAA